MVQLGLEQAIRDQPVTAATYTSIHSTDYGSNLIINFATVVVYFQ